MSYGNYTKQISLLAFVWTIALVGWTRVTAAADSTDSVVTIYTKTNNGGSSQGTGFVIGGGGRVVTAYHVVEDAKRIELFSKSGTNDTNIQIEWIDPKRDIAILRSAKLGKLPALRITQTDPTAIAAIQITGSPRGLPQQTLFGNTTSAGYISSQKFSSAGGKRLFAEEIDVIPVDVTVYSGLSGAPAISASGEVVGILSGSFDQGRGIAWIIPSKYIASLMVTSRTDKTVEQMASWPSLSLMDTAWISLKRTYATEFTADHVARLEVLDGAFRTLKGAWSGASSKPDLLSETTLGRCERQTYVRIQASTNHIDSDSAQIRGTAQIYMKVVAKFTDAQQFAYDTPVLRDQRKGFCNQSIFGDTQVSERESTWSGDLTITTPSARRSNQRSAQLQAFIAVSRCDGACTAKSFGKQALGNVEIIDSKHGSERIRWIETILQKKS